MAYEQEISRWHPAYFIFLPDQSGLMNRPVGGGVGVLNMLAIGRVPLSRILQWKQERCKQ